MNTIGDQIRKAREAKGWAQTDLAREAKVSQQTIAKIESGVTNRSRHMAPIALALQLDLPDLGIYGSLPDRSSTPVENPTADSTSSSTIPVFTTSLSSHGQIWRTDEGPIEYIARPSPIGTAKGYGLYLVETDMAPAFEPGDIALVHELLPPMPGTYCVFFGGVVEGHTSKYRRVAVRRLVSIDDDGYTVEQFRPHEEEFFSETDWVRAQRVVGRYQRF